MKQEQLTEEQLREQWLERRRGGLGGSDSPVIVLGDVYGKTPLDVYLDKMGRGQEVDPNSPDIQRGSMLEHYPVDMFTRDTGADVYRPRTLDERYSGFWFDHPDVGCFYANLDGYVGKPSEQIVEVKCPRMAGFMRAKDEGLSDYYQIQGQHQMAVTGASVVHFLIFNAELWDYVHIPLDRDQEMIDLILAKGTAFWSDHVEKEIAPTEGEVTDAPVVKKKGGKYIDLSESDIWQDAVAMYREADNAEKDAKAQKSEAREAMAGLMEQAGHEAIKVGRDKFTFGSGTRTSFDKKALAAAHPEIDLSAFTRTTVTKPGLSAYLAKEQKEESK